MLNTGYDYQELAVLYVDDEPQSLKYFVRGFSKDFRIETASSAAEAWTMVQDHSDRIGVLVTDQRMPGLSGTDLMQQVRQRCPHIVRILVTGYSDLEAAVQAVNLGGAFRFIAKPWDGREFRGVLLRAMEFSIVQRDRDRLLREKLHVLQRMGVMDRVRGLSVLAASFQGRLRHPQAALTAYLRQAPIRDATAETPSHATSQEMDVREWNRNAMAGMLRAVRQVTDELRDLGTPEQHVLLAESAGRAVDASRTTLAPPLDVQFHASRSLASVRAVPSLLQRMLGNLMTAVARLDGDTTSISVTVADQGQHAATVQVVSDGTPWTSAQLAPLFAHVMPRTFASAAADLDLLASFFMAQHHGGTIDVQPDMRTLTATIRQNSLPSEEPDGSVWFDEIIREMEEWEP